MSVLEEECSLGDPDAWHDQALDSVFVRSTQYRRLKIGNTCFISGRRGTGKSALAIRTKTDQKYCEVFGGDTDQYDLYKNVVRTYIDEYQLEVAELENVVAQLWRYVLAIASLKVLDTAVPEDTPVGSQITQYREDRRLLDARIGDAIDYAFNKSLLAADGNRPGAAMRISRCLNRLWKDPELNAILDQTSKHTKDDLWIIFDSLERYDFGEPEMVAALRGIARAVLAFGTHGSDRSRYRVHFSMPGEIFEDVASIAPGKILPKTVTLKWRYGELVSMLSMRYMEMLSRARIPHDQKIVASGNEVLREHSKANDAGRILRDRFWYEGGLLPAQISNRSGDVEDTFAYIFRHTQLRPRELITVFNGIIEASLETLPRLSASAIVNSLHSPAILQNLVRDAVSPFEDVFDGFLDATSAVFHGEKRILKGFEFTRLAKRIHQSFHQTDIGVEEFTGYLLRAGLVGEYLRNHPHNLYTPARFEYLLQDRVALSSESVYCVHPTVGDFFEMQNVKGYGPIYPRPEDDDWIKG